MDQKIRAARDLRPGVVIDGFVLEKVIHKGGMAVIWSVTHPDVTLPAIMKVPMIGDGDDTSSIVGFEMEQMIMPTLTGKHVPKVFGMGDITEFPYIAMERIIGPTLEEIAARLPIAPELAAELCGKIALGLIDLHRQHVIHFDLKPQNIIFRESTGDAVFVDFGLSRHALLPDLFAVEIRIPMGTAPYIAPEQVVKNRTDPRSDIFSLGAILYELVTGAQPFGAPESTAGLRRRIWADPRPPRLRNKNVPAWLQEIILRCLEPDPNKRYPDARHLAMDLLHPGQVVLSDRATKTSNNGPFKVWWNSKVLGIPDVLVHHAPPQGVNTAPIVMAAIDLSSTHAPLAEAVRSTVERILSTSPDARLACVNVLKTSLLSVDETVDDNGRNIHLQHLAELKHWARPLARNDERITFHVLEGTDPAGVITRFAHDNQVDHIIMGARGHSARRRYLGSTSTQVVAEASCSVTVVRLPQSHDPDEHHDNSPVI